MNKLYELYNSGKDELTSTLICGFCGGIFYGFYNNLSFGLFWGGIVGLFISLSFGLIGLIFGGLIVGLASGLIYSLSCWLTILIIHLI